MDGCEAGAHLLEKTWAKVAGSGDEGESVYGLNEDFKPLVVVVVGDGMSWVAVAITWYASPQAQEHGGIGPWRAALVWCSRSPERPHRVDRRSRGSGARLNAASSATNKAG